MRHSAACDTRIGELGFCTRILPTRAWELLVSPLTFLFPVVTQPHLTLVNL